MHTWMKQRTFWRYWIQNKLNQHYDNQNTGRTLYLWHYFMQNPKAPQAKKIQHNSFFSQVCFQFFLQICGYKSGFAVENPQNSVWLDWLSAQPKNSNAPLWRVCQPWIHESECLSTIPFARNTESNTWSTYNTRTSGRGHRPWRCRQRGN